MSDSGSLSLDSLINMNKRIENLERQNAEVVQIVEQLKNLLLKANEQATNNLTVLQTALMLVMLRTLGVEDKNIINDLKTYISMARLLVNDEFRTSGTTLEITTKEAPETSLD